MLDVVPAVSWQMSAGLRIGRALEMPLKDKLLERHPETATKIVIPVDWAREDYKLNQVIG